MRQHCDDGPCTHDMAGTFTSKVHDIRHAQAGSHGRVSSTPALLRMGRSGRQFDFGDKVPTTVAPFRVTTVT
jgi:hypothetical protein